MKEIEYYICTAIDTKYDIRKAFTLGKVYSCETIIGGIKEFENDLGQGADYHAYEVGKYFVKVPERIKATYHGICICVIPFEEYHQKYEMNKEYVFCFNEYEVPYIANPIGHIICEQFFKYFKIKEIHKLNVESKAQIHINFYR